MRFGRRHRTTVVAAGVVGVLATAGLTSASAATSAASAPASVQAERLSGQLGAMSGGYYLVNNRPVVNVVTQSAAAKVRAAGLTPKMVEHSFATLTATKNALDRVGYVKYASWGIDTSTDQVEVTISDQTPKAAANKLMAAVKRYGSEVRVEHTADAPKLFVRGGDAIQNSVARCSAGFNARRNGQLVVVTAGHCTELGGTWSPMGGTVLASNSPGGDEGLISNPSGNGPSQVNDGTTITSIASPSVGLSIRKSGSTTGITTGRISAVNQTVNFDVGVIRNLFQTNVRAAAGDSGGPAYAGSVGLGTLTGGNTTTTFFYPASIEFSDFGLTLP